jgi:hypothetical protein
MFHARAGSGIAKPCLLFIHRADASLMRRTKDGEVEGDVYGVRRGGPGDLETRGMGSCGLYRILRKHLIGPMDDCLQWLPAQVAVGKVTAVIFLRELDDDDTDTRLRSLSMRDHVDPPKTVAS